VVELVERLAALSRAGIPLRRSWELLARRHDVARLVVAMLDVGGDAGTALRLAGASARADPRLPWLAAVWTVTERTGAPLADVLDRFADGLRAEREVARARDAAVAGPRATTAVLTAFPAVGLCLGHLLGAHPLDTLLRTSPGRVLLVAGAGSWLVGRLWIVRLVAGAARPPRSSRSRARGEPG